jgi:hypothetical protein
VAGTGRLTSRRGLLIAGVLSLFVHGLLIMTSIPDSIPDLIKPPGATELTLELILERPRPDAPPVEEPPAEAEEPPVIEPPLVEEPPPVEEPPEDDPGDDEAVEPTVTQTEVVLPAPIMKLNLERPDNWDEIVESVPGPAPARSLAFNPALEQRLNDRLADKARKGLLSAREAAIYGVSDDAFARKGGLGEEIKLDGSCYILIEDRGVEEGARWWPSQCTETRKKPLNLDPVEYDALGRIITD